MQSAACEATAPAVVPATRVADDATEPEVVDALPADDKLATSVESDEARVAEKSSDIELGSPGELAPTALALDTPAESQAEALRVESDEPRAPEKAADIEPGSAVELAPTAPTLDTPAESQATETAPLLEETTEETVPTDAEKCDDSRTDSTLEDVSLCSFPVDGSGSDTADPLVGRQPFSNDDTDSIEELSNAEITRQIILEAVAEAENPKPDMIDKMLGKVLDVAEQGADVVSAKSQALEKKIEQGMGYLAAKSEAFDQAATTYFKSTEEFVMERSKSVVESMQSTSSYVSGKADDIKRSDSVKKGFDFAKAKTEAPLLKVSKSVEFASERTEAACSAAKDAAESTLEKVESLAEVTFGKVGAACNSLGEKTRSKLNLASAKAETSRLLVGSVIGKESSLKNVFRRRGA